MPHVLVRLAGHGVTITPAALPMLIRRDAASSIVQITVGDVVRTVALAHWHKDGPEAQHLADFATGPAHNWRIQTSVYECDWPLGYSLHVGSEAASPPFDLLGAASEALFVQGPFSHQRVSEIEVFVGAGQSERSRGKRGEHNWILVDYTHAGEPWVQHHITLPLGSRSLVVSGQAPRSRELEVLRDANAVAQSIRATHKP